FSIDREPAPELVLSILLIAATTAVLPAREPAHRSLRSLAWAANLHRYCTSRSTRVPGSISQGRIFPPNHSRRHTCGFSASRGLPSSPCAPCRRYISAARGKIDNTLADAFAAGCSGRVIKVAETPH